MSAISQPHDVLFKHFMGDITIAKDFLIAHLPPSLIPHCDMSTLRLENTSFVSPELRHRLADALYSFKINGEDAYAYILIEHQRTVDEQMPFRLLEYQVAAMRRHIDQKRGKRPPLVIPILFYQGTQSPYPHSLDIRDYIDQPKLAWQLFPGATQLVDLSIIPDEKLQTHGRAAAYEMVMKHVRTRDIFLIFKDILKVLAANPLGVDKVSAILQSDGTR